MRRMRDEHVGRICRAILARWKDKGLVRAKAPDEVLLGKMAQEILADFRREDALDREVEALMERHARDLSAQGANSRVLFQKIKERLARERNIVL